MNRLCCFLTGGHRYADADLKVELKGNTVIFTNKCAKCGKERTTEISAKNVFADYMLNKKGE